MDNFFCTNGAALCDDILMEASADMHQIFPPCCVII